MSQPKSMVARRRKQKEGEGDEQGGPQEDNVKQTSNDSIGLFMLFGLLLVGFYYFLSSPQQQQQGDVQVLKGSSTTVTQKSLVKSPAKEETGRVVMIDDKVKLVFDMNQISSGDVVGLGPHAMRVLIEGDCPQPRLHVRLHGDALVNIAIQNDWSASFDMPVEGSYKVDAKWFGCEGSSSTPVSPAEAVAFTAKEGGYAPRMVSSNSSSPSFPTGFWLSKAKFPSQETIKSDYVWLPIEMRNSTLPTTFYQESKATTVMEGNPIPGAFSKLSNYEVVCFVGSPSAAGAYHQAFLSLRAQISSAQRPFKFHYYKVTDFTKPDQHWTDRHMSRKCKHTLVSVDELDMDLSQQEYKQQVKEFLEGVVKCLHDDTFVVWMFTVNHVLPTSNRLCHSTSTTSQYHHPCNTALLELFQEKALPDWVKLLDNTDLSYAQPEAKDLVATIAMRIFALIGFKVELWRKVGQAGRVDGLHRNGQIENDPADVCF